MDFLRSLILRSLGDVDTVEPPRIPYVSVYPDGVPQDEGSAEPTEVTSPTIAHEAPAPERAARADGTETAPQVRPRFDDDAEPPAIVPTTAPPPVPTDASTPTAPPRTPHPMGEQPPAIIPPPLAPPVTDRVEPRPEAPVQRQEIVRTTHETTRIHEIQNLQRHTDRFIEREVVRPAASKDELTPRVLSKRTPESPIRPRPKPDMTPKLPARIAPPERAEPPAAAPAIHVNIGRVTVAVQAPASPSDRTVRVRPAPPAMDLDAYNARVRKPR
mgnify:CR=1 FL=1